jgi:hypothetical protein
MSPPIFARRIINLMKNRTEAVMYVPMLILLLGNFPTITMAQSNKASALAASTAKEPTNITGVEIFSDRPKSFNPLTATNEELSIYGLPTRPDGQADRKAYAQWERAMAALKYRPSAKLEAKPYSSREMMPAHQPSAIYGLPTQYGAYNWSGAAVTNKNKTWNKSTSFDYVSSVFNVPAAQPPFGACSNGITGPFYEVSWNGIDGISAGGDVLQGGSDSYADCTHSLQTGTYFGWVEWYPSYPILELTCGTEANPPSCPVFPGDDFYVVTMGAAGCAEQFVFVEDITSGWGGTYGLTWLNGPCLVGNSAEWIVERPAYSCGNDGICYYALANTVFDFFDNSYAEDGHGTQFYSGSQGTTTDIFTMLDDSGNIETEFVEAGSAGYQGKYSLWFQNENCAYSDGCTP